MDWLKCDCGVWVCTRCRSKLRRAKLPSKLLWWSFTYNAELCPSCGQGVHYAESSG